MKIQFLVAALLLGCAVSVRAQTKPAAKLVNNLPFDLVTPARAQQLVERKIVLRLRDVTLLQALQELQKQSGVRFDSADLVAREVFARKLSLDLETTSFSRAFDAILKAAKTKGKLEQQGGNLAWNLRFGHFASALAWSRSGVGLFQVQLGGVNSTLSRTVTPQMGAGQSFGRAQVHETRLFLSEVATPGLQSVGSPYFRLTRVEDEQGRSLLTGAKDEPFRFGLDSHGAGNLLLKLPVAGTKKLARIEGKAIFVVPTTIENWELPNVLDAKNVSHTFGSGAQTTIVTVHSAKRDGNNVNLDISLFVPPPSDISSVRAPLASSEIFLSALAIKRSDGQTANTPRLLRRWRQQPFERASLLLPWIAGAAANRRHRRRHRSGYCCAHQTGANRSAVCV